MCHMQQEKHTWLLWIRKVLWHVGIAHHDGYLGYICQAEPGCSGRRQNHLILFFISPFDWLGFLFVPEIKNWHRPQKYVHPVPLQPGHLCVSSTAIHEFPKDYFTNEERIEGAVGLHVLCVSITWPLEVMYSPSPAPSLRLWMNLNKSPPRRSIMKFLKFPKVLTDLLGPEQVK